jgi:hypothetical protein
MSEEWQKSTEPLPMTPIDNDEFKMTPIHPLSHFDTRTPQELQKQIKMAEDTARFFKSHWLFFYLSTAFAFWRGYQQRQTEKAIRKLADKK